ncbi:MAG: hypothetical protein N5P05_004112 (plasmid) [Chroococcopsis gigantea SAG 12.99]|jgi:predicted aspartyl protease|nr:hypothetical protein [Chroococcopsis gigantea SAG 12.99]
MIRGRFSENYQIFFSLDLIADEEFNLPVDALLNTGFTGFLAINKQDVECLNWEYSDEEILFTAQGFASFDKYIGKVLIDGHEFEIPIFAGDNIQEILMGSQWFRTFDLTVKYRKGEIILE